MTKFLIGAAALALLSANPASAQLLGGGGGGGGMLGGTLGGLGGMGGGTIGGAGSLGGSMGDIGRIPSTATDTATDAGGRTSNSGRVDKSVNRRNGRVAASGSGSTDSTIASTTSAAGRSFGGSGAGSASGSGAAEAQLIGTDNVRSIAGQTAGTARGGIEQSREATGSAASSVQGYTSNAGGGATGTVTGSGSGNVFVSPTRANNGSSAPKRQTTEKAAPSQ